MRNILPLLSAAWVAAMVAVSPLHAAGRLSAGAARADDPVDSTLVGRNILSLIPRNIRVDQTQAVWNALQAHIKANGEKPLTGYRIRVFQDNSPSARRKSEEIAATLRSRFPGVGVYRTFESPNYRVALGDFRTKDDALGVYRQLRGTYPTAYIIREPIHYPQ